MSKILIALYVFATSLALILLKLGTKNGSPVSYVDSKLQFNINPYVVIGIGLYGTSFILYTFLISKFDIGYIIPLTTAFVYILIFVASYVIFKESFSATKILAIILILAGVSLLSLKK
jgi:drug/metabolite transporter (DMT)-like permease